MEIHSTKSKGILYHYLCSEKIFNRIYGDVDFHHGKCTLTCRNKCNFTYYFLELCIVKRAEMLCEYYKYIHELFVKILRHSIEKYLRVFYFIFLFYFLTRGRCGRFMVVGGRFMVVVRWHGWRATRKKFERFTVVLRWHGRWVTRKNFGRFSVVLSWNFRTKRPVVRDRFSGRFGQKQRSLDLLGPLQIINQWFLNPQSTQFQVVAPISSFFVYHLRSFIFYFPILISDS